MGQQYRVDTGVHQWQVGGITIMASGKSLGELQKAILKDIKATRTHLKKEWNKKQKLLPKEKQQIIK